MSHRRLDFGSSERSFGVTWWRVRTVMVGTVTKQGVAEIAVQLRMEGNAHDDRHGDDGGCDEVDGHAERGATTRTEPALSYSPPRVLVREHRQPAHTAAKSRPSSVPMTIRRHESARSGVIHTSPAVQANARTSLLDAHR